MPLETKFLVPWFWSNKLRFISSLKVAGINPHAGEEGILGHEEKDWLNDALITWNAKNKGIELLLSLIHI